VRSLTKVGRKVGCEKRGLRQRSRPVGPHVYPKIDTHTTKKSRRGKLKGMGALGFAANTFLAFKERDARKGILLSAAPNWDKGEEATKTQGPDITATTTSLNSFSRGNIKRERSEEIHALRETYS